MVLSLYTKLQLANCSQKDRDGKSLAIDIYVKMHTAKKHCTKCCGIDHFKITCPNTNEKCYHCLADGHTYKSCTGDREPQCIFCTAANIKSSNFAYKDSTILTNHRFTGCRIYQDIYERVKTVMTYNDSIQSNNMYFDNVSTEI